MTSAADRPRHRAPDDTLTADNTPRGGHTGTDAPDRRGDSTGAAHIAADGTGPAIELAGVEIRFRRGGADDLVIVRDLSMRISPGSLVCVAGRSGSGKTSILRVAAGLTSPTAGTVRWWGTDIATLPDADVRQLRRRRIGYADQAASTVPELSALENVLLPSLPDGRSAVRQRRTRALNLLDVLGLASRAGHRPAALSGGERGRVVLARAMLMQPEVLIADEPTAGLDRATADHIINLLRDRAREGAVLVASHDPHVIEAAADVITVEDEPKR